MMIFVLAMLTGSCLPIVECAALSKEMARSCICFMKGQMTLVTRILMALL